MSDESDESNAPAQTCPHAALSWRPEPCNETGWCCQDCSATLGYRPDLDRLETGEKVAAVLTGAHCADLLYVSNGSEGEIITQSVAARCRAENTYDQQSILTYILDDPNIARHHAAFWRDRAGAWLQTEGK